MCTHPIVRSIKKKNGEVNTYETPCGTCYECMMMKRTQWAQRNRIEFDNSRNAYFLTLTYSDTNITKLPYNRLAQLYEHPPVEIQLFFKRLRKKIDNVRYFYCSEYGTNTLRPHFHALVYTNDPVRLKSSEIQKIWNNGDIRSDRITSQRIHYVTKYMDKYINGYTSRNKYDYLHSIDNYTITAEQERSMIISMYSYTRCSSRPPLGTAFYASADIMDYVRTTAFQEGYIPKITYKGITSSIPRCFLRAYFTEDERDQLYDNYRLDNFSEKRIIEKSIELDITPTELRSYLVDQSNRKIDIINQKHQLLSPDIL